MKVSVVNLGCKVNRVESDSIAASYRSRGAQLVDASAADLIVVNTCTVTGMAEKKTRKTIRRVLKDNAAARVLVTGCAASIDPAFFEQLDRRVSVVDKADLLDDGAQLLRTGAGFPTRVGIKVQDGCNHSCTYCIVHVARGKAWSRPHEAIVAEARALSQAGVREIVLTGIDLGSYRSERGHLAALVRDLLAAAPRTRFRISSVEPCSLDDELIELMASSDGMVCRHLHLPLQAGSDKVLKEMNRPYSVRYFDELVSKLRSSIPQLSLSTDIIAGFPGETDSEFDETLALARRAGFSKIHAFRYSKRRGTPAAERTDQIAPEIAEERARRLAALGDELRIADAISRVGTSELVVIEDDGSAVTESYHRLETQGHPLPGEMVEVRFTGVDGSGILRA